MAMEIPASSSSSFGNVLAEAYDTIDAYSKHTGGQLEDIQRRFEQSCAQLRSIMRDTEIAVDEAESEEASHAYIKALSDQKTAYEALKLAYREASVSRKEVMRQRIQEARKELLDAPNPAERRKQWKTEADLMAASKGVTDTLARTKNMLAQELEHSGAQLAAIELSQERLDKTRKEYDNQHGKLKVGQGLIKAIDWQNQSERYLMWAGLALFGAVAAYIVQKRCIYFVPESLRPMAVLRYGYSMLKKMDDQAD